ncbi:hypothetical protein [Streptomyces flavofungini]|uniref:Secreted protein n=1 Tax=Streptomyces flavofungini TaxID=68200 RepID=A0ABS0XIR1_9ACTN|nr:hypothetical protein [Streptomyces flavofungini]MBJ3813116.1 hypothetical protein [Streptomyces flavofungini]GHC89532.1 hypothetical protein GCM10010349_77430 [Streptomyces flavofungini]
MDAWVTLLATVVGAAIALMGQHFMKRAEDRSRLSELLLEQCALVAASAADFEGRIWEERVLGLEGRVSGFDLSANQLAFVRLRILSRDRALSSALEELNEAGEKLGSYWRRGGGDDAEVTRRWTRHHSALVEFIAVSGEVVPRRLASA